MNLRILLAVLVVLTLPPFSYASDSDCVLKMGFRTNERLPDIEKSPNNSGFYLDFYTLAASRVGCQLQVIRRPKNQIIAMLKNGEVDFYPVFTMTSARSKYVYYIKTGITGGDIGISHKGLEEITSLTQLKGKVLLRAQGSPNSTQGIDGIDIKQPPEMSSEKAIKYILSGRGDFYLYNKSSLFYLLKNNPEPDLKVHLDCCGGPIPLYVGFSQNSPWFTGKTNSNFDENAPLTITNYPVIIDQSSLVYRLSVELNNMTQKGETETIYNKHYK